MTLFFFWKIRVFFTGFSSFLFGLHSPFLFRYDLGKSFSRPFFHQAWPTVLFIPLLEYVFIDAAGPTDYRLSRMGSKVSPQCNGASFFMILDALLGTRLNVCIILFIPVTLTYAKDPVENPLTRNRDISRNGSFWSSSDSKLWTGMDLSISSATAKGSPFSSSAAQSGFWPSVKSSSSHSFWSAATSSIPSRCPRGKRNKALTSKKLTSRSIELIPSFSPPWGSHPTSYQRPTPFFLPFSIPLTNPHLYSIT